MSDLSPLCAQERTSQKGETLLPLQWSKRDTSKQRGEGVLPVHVNVFVPSYPIAIPAEPTIRNP